MGCGPSKVDDLQLVSFCRERKDLIRSAADHRFTLAAAHIAYFRQLRDVGESLCRFVEEDLILSAASSSPSSLSSLSSPVLTLPSDEGKPPKKKVNDRKGKGVKTASSSTSISHNLKGDEEREDGSHLHWSSSSSGASEPSSSSHHHNHHHHHHDGHLEIDEEDEDEDEENRSHHGKVKRAPSPQPGISYVSPPNSNYPYPFDPYYNNNNNPPTENYYANPYYPPPMNPYHNINNNVPPYSYYSSNYYPENDANLYGSSTSYTTYYMKKSSTRIPSVIYEEPKQNPVYSFSDYPNYPPYGDYPNYPPNGGAGYFGGVNRQQNQQQQRPPTPPSPKVSTWDYFNPFETFESGSYPGYYSQAGYGSNASSPDSREVREMEGIPDLEEETECEVSKEPYNEKRKMHDGFPKSKRKTVQFEDLKGNNDNNLKKKTDNFGEGTSKGVPMYNQERGEPKLFRQPEPESEPEPEPEEVRGVKSSSPETEISISTSPDEISVKKKGVSFDVGGTSHLDVDSSKPSSLTTLSANGTRDLREVVREIKDEFEAATDYGNEVSQLLEVGKEPYRSRNSFLSVMLAKVCSASLSSYHTPSNLAGGYDPEDNLDSRSLTSTLDKLYVWEKKLFKEVKDEERLRVMYEKQCRKLKALDDEGAEGSRIEATQALIRKLLTKINVSVRAVDSISSRIHKLRDEELQPRMKELIYGLRRMWKLMLKCHQRQFQAILESQTRALKANTGLRRDSSVRATIQLEAELIKWCHRFKNWIEMQKSYADTLNHWLVKCLHYEPEITVDGEVPYSPGRIGAPPVFVICHDWKQAMERISVSEVHTAMNDFATSLHQLWERQDEEQRRRLKSETMYKDFEKQIRAIKMERQRRGHGHEDALSDKNSLSMVASESGISPLDDLKVDLDSIRQRVKEQRAGHKEAVKLVHDAVSRSIQAGLIPIFEALESFTSEASKAFDDVRLEHAAGNAS